MTKISRSLIFLGSGPLANKSLEWLNSYFEIEAVITKQSPVWHKGDVPVKDYCKKNNIKLFYANSSEELNNIITKANFKSLVGVTVDFGVIISSAVISNFKKGIINSHFSLLPEWRGADPITYSLLSGQKFTGVSLMLINEKLDTGKIIASEGLEIREDDNNLSLSCRLLDLSNRLLCDNIADYLTEEIQGAEQPTTPPTYSKKTTKQQGQLDPRKMAPQLEREIKAFSSWPQSWIEIRSHKVFIKDSRASKQRYPKGSINVINGGLFFGCRAGSLELKVLKPAGKKEMSAKDFINGYSRLLK